MADKFARSGMTAVKSSRVNAPIVEEFPLTMECTLLEEVRTDSLHMIVGKIVNVVADETVLDENGKIDAAKLHAIAFDQFGRSYMTMGDKIAGAWQAGVPLMGE
jgi:flavin reductase (DIM6/NTAB) family NADH-FMN oxidoreductase RutF